MSKTMIEARHLTKVYRMGHVQLEVLKGVSLRVGAGEFVAIMGPSGAGKSTLLHLLAGLDTPTSGDVLWEGKVVSHMSDTQRASFRNRMVGVVFQFYHLLPELSALENVMLPGLVNGQRSGRALKERALACLEQVGLGARIRHRPGELSGGEQQRVAIARALLNQPTVLFCDEPTGNLDSKTGQAIADLLVSLYRAARLAFVLVTHEAGLANLADRVLHLRDGQFVQNASVLPSAQRR